VAASFLDDSLVVKVEYGVWEIKIAVENPSGKAMRLLGRKSRAAREAAPGGDRSEKHRQRPVTIKKLALLSQSIVNVPVVYEKSKWS
jgi:hypothetical protein